MAKRSTGLRLQPSGGSRAQALPAGKKQLLAIERLAGDGRGIAFHEGRTWFVHGALAGEHVEARVLGSHGKVVEARAERVLQPSPLRRPAPCAHAGTCGGCSVQHLPHAEQLAFKQRQLADQLRRVAGVTPQHWAAPLASPEFGYRRRARVAVRWDPKQQRLEVGFRAASSQAIVAVSQCPVLVQPLQPVLLQLPGVLAQLAKPKAIGHVELFHGTATAVLVRHTAPLPASDLACLARWCQGLPAQLWLQGEGAPQPYEPGASLGFTLQPWGLTLNYRPGDFVQVNEQVNAAMVAQALSWLNVQPGERVLDLFCGLGNFALPLARQAGEVVAVEGVEAMVARAGQNAVANGLGNVRVYRADLAEPLHGEAWAQGGFDAVLLDPPREGAFETVQGLSSTGAARVVYVSCNPATLARDTVQLLEQGYRLTCAGVLDMFPQTSHVEAMALFEKSTGTRAM
ncbi:23S rRNA (uracil(1939)-C(5))-methyltransferase RlmD [Pseudomonas typographi]|uniref:23S rRNA (uracil(1939)-C(5))-methyltransferase RlmD n=1 Tax=Pseudomonas typographi TaxID=2715964 RepID=A0ABR7Z0K6_9PSED|nr:23S rRNA (uracil(1939)-C(5))-methyltransferase RlmD [Pseudomonas typographi]MBD1589308.1 23S rRNA (uracil(1939)-C(5))-methyltransferase RlmD [Pseudomonas typographi]MBD1598985.1 23S rRNA (uracil(1939)-C(5))-methyltransferase RlmD [Pseudomonas typographi]